jgi:hypothetical protein
VRDEDWGNLVFTYKRLILALAYAGILDLGIPLKIQLRKILFFKS